MSQPIAGSGNVRPWKGKLAPYVRKAPFPPDHKHPDYRQYVLQGRLSMDTAAQLLLWETPLNTGNRSDDLTEMAAYLRRAVRKGEFPRFEVDGVHALDLMLWAFWTGLELPEELKRFATRQGSKASRIITDVWLTREVWPLTEAINLSWGFPPEVIASETENRVCLDIDRLDQVEELLDQAGQTIMRDDGKLDVRRDDFLAVVLREGFWLPSPLIEAAESLQKRAEAPDEVGSVDAHEQPDLPTPHDITNVTALYRCLAKYHWSLFPAATPKEIFEKVGPFMRDVLGVDQSWLGSRSQTTIHYKWLKGLNSRQGKPGPKSRATDDQDFRERAGIAVKTPGKTEKRTKS